MKHTANTRALVESAIDFSKGANREPWGAYVSRMSGIIAPWRTGYFLSAQSRTREKSAIDEPFPDIPYREPV
jgi:hypothetical protein